MIKLIWVTIAFLSLLTITSCRNIPAAIESVLRTDSYFDKLRRTKEERKQSYYHDWNYVYSFATTRTNDSGKPINDDATSCQMADAVMYYSLKYNLDPQIVARKIWKETWYSQWARSCVMSDSGRYIRDKNGNVIPIAWGLSQINLNANAWVLKKIAGGKYASMIHCRKDEESLIWNIEINVETGCYILSNYLSMYNDYSLSLCAYWAGQNSSHFRDLKWKGVRNQYIDEILNPSVFEYNAAVYHGWRYKDRKDWRLEPDPFEDPPPPVKVVSK